MRTYAPYFDGRTSWYSNSWTYKDSYAVYKNDDGSPADNARYILKDGSGNKLFIPYGCGGGTCPLYAADIGDPGFRAAWIAELRQTMGGGNYKGIFVDDVNMEFRVSDGNGDHKAPVNPRTGRAMTETEWKNYMADFMEEIRAAFPGKEIVHNALWFAGHDDPRRGPPAARRRRDQPRARRRRRRPDAVAAASSASRPSSPTSTGCTATARP